MVILGETGLTGFATPALSLGRIGFAKRHHMIWAWFKRNRHDPPADQRAPLSARKYYIGDTIAGDYRVLRVLKTR